MAGQGLTSLFPIRSLALMGLLNLVPKIFVLKALLKRTGADIEGRRPHIHPTAGRGSGARRPARPTDPGCGHGGKT
jgi:lipid-A-disaccharide synthase